MSKKRLLISSALGFASGLICLSFASSHGSLPLTLALSIIFGRMMIGVAIGISRFPMNNWAIHGIVMGFVFSLPSGFGAMSGAETSGFSPITMCVATIVMGMVYGFLIELFTSLIFDAKQQDYSK